MQRKGNNKILSNKTGSKLRIAVVVSEYNSDITYPMRDAAITTLQKAGVKEVNIKVLAAPGGFEIPIICQRLAKTRKYDGIIAVGCVIKGDTDHYHFIAQESTRGVMDVMLRFNIPIANAILTVNNLHQAQIRSQGETNKGIEAAAALLSIL